MGTLLAGVGIAITGTVLPGIVKEFFARRADAVTGIYLMGMAIGAALASGAAVPVAEVLDSWQASLAAWGGLASWRCSRGRRSRGASTSTSRRRSRTPATALGAINGWRGSRARAG